MGRILRKQDCLLNRLPPVRGEYRENTPLSALTWFRTGGEAEVLFTPADEKDLQNFLRHKPGDIPVTVIGAGSNLLVRDGGVHGVVVRLGKAFGAIQVTGENIIEAGAAALDSSVAKTAVAHGLAGLEFYCGIPGSVGGALRMNAGCYGKETRDVLQSALAVDPEGSLHELSNVKMGFDYRHCNVPQDWIFVRARFQGHLDDPTKIRARMKQIRTSRLESQPQGVRTGGSTFRNPGGPTSKTPKAWQLIENAGGRGLTVGEARMSEKHCNFMVNMGGATSTDLEQLGETVRTRVLANSGIDLHWEIRRIGEANK